MPLSVYSEYRGQSVNPQDERPQTVVFPLANSTEFCQAVLDDIEFVFRKQYGPKWTPELQQFFQALRSTCLQSAARIDDGLDAGAIRPLREAVVLTMGSRRG